MKIRILHMQDKKFSRTQQIMNLMKRSGGASNWELNKVMFRYGAVIHRLRKDGHFIHTKCLKKGLYQYYLVEEK